MLEGLIAEDGWSEGASGTEPGAALAFSGVVALLMAPSTYFFPTHSSLPNGNYAHDGKVQLRIALVLAKYKPSKLPASVWPGDEIMRLHPAGSCQKFNIRSMQFSQ